MKKIATIILILITWSSFANATIMLNRYTTFQGFTNDDKHFIDLYRNKDTRDRAKAIYRQWEDVIAKKFLATLLQTSKAFKNIATLQKLSDDNMENNNLFVYYWGGKEQANRRSYGSLNLQASRFLTAQGQIGRELSYSNVYIGAYYYLKDAQTVKQYRKRVLGLALLALDFDDPKKYNPETREAICRYTRCKYKPPYRAGYGAIKESIELNIAQGAVLISSWGIGNNNYTNTYTTFKLADISIAMLFSIMNRLSVDRYNKKVLAEKYKAILLLSNRNFEDFDNLLKKDYPLFRNF